MSNKCRYFVKTLIKNMQNKVRNARDIKKMLPYGSIKTIARRSDVSIFTVSRVIKGSSNNPKVLRNIKDYIEEINKVDSDINSLIAEFQTA